VQEVFAFVNRNLSGAQRRMDVTAERMGYDKPNKSAKMQHVPQIARDPA
jgi:hypothetical protein